MTLNSLQAEFTADFLAFGSLAVRWGVNHGYTVILEEAYRHPSATHGHAKSLHRKKLAAHLLLLKSGKLISNSQEYEPLGEIWEALHPDNAWGGRFDDGVHFSRSYQGMR